MNEQNQRDSIMSMARGAFEERVDYEMDKVIQNILDPNTKATAKRKITLAIIVIVLVVILVRELTKGGRP